MEKNPFPAPTGKTVRAMSPSWQMALLQHDRFSPFVLEAAKVLCHMANRQDFEIRNSVQLIRYETDVGYDGLHCNHGGAVACHMLGWNWLSVANLIGFERDYGELKPQLDSVAAWDMSSIFSFLFNNNTERAMLAFYRMRQRMGDTVASSTLKSVSKKTAAEVAMCFGTMSTQEASYIGIYASRLVAIGHVAAHYEMAFNTTTFNHNQLQHADQDNQIEHSGQDERLAAVNQ